MKHFGKILTAVLSASLLLFASCSNSSDSGGSSSSSTTETKTMVYKGTYTVAGSSYDTIKIVQEKKTDGTYNRTYTMTGTGTSDSGIWDRAVSTASIAKAVTMLKSGSYLLQSSKIKNSNGDAAIWKFTTDASGNVTLGTIGSTQPGYVSASGTGTFDSNASSETSGGGDSSGGSEDDGKITVNSITDVLNAVKTKLSLTGDFPLTYDGTTKKNSDDRNHWIFGSGTKSIYILGYKLGDTTMYDCYYGTLQYKTATRWTDLYDKALLHTSSKYGQIQVANKKGSVYKFSSYTAKNSFGIKKGTTTIKTHSDSDEEWNEL